MKDDAQFAQRLAGRALSLARARVRRPAAVTVLVGLAQGRRAAVELARSRCLAAVDQNPCDVAARRAVDLLAAALNRLVR